MASRAEGSIVPINGMPPLNQHVDAIIDSRKFKAVLMYRPLKAPVSTGPSGSAGHAGSDASRLTRAQRKRKQEAARIVAETERAQAQWQHAPPSTGAKGGSSGKGGGKGKGQSKGAFRLPHALVRLGCVAEHNGEPICFSYNLNGCTSAPSGGRCGRGLHICAKCFEPHSAVEKHSA